MFSRHNVAIAAFVVVLVTAFGAFKACQPTPTKFDTIEEAKAACEGIGLHCRELFKATNPILVVSTHPLTEEQAIEFTGPVGRSRIHDAAMVVPLLGPHNIDPSIAVRVGDFQLVGDAKLIERIANLPSR